MSKPLSPEQIEAMRALPLNGLPNKLAVAIKLADISQVELSQEIGEHQPDISDLKNGNYRTLTVDRARKYADYFGCTIEDLFPAREEVA